MLPGLGRARVLSASWALFPSSAASSSLGNAREEGLTAAASPPLPEWFSDPFDILVGAEPVTRFLLCSPWPAV